MVIFHSYVSLPEGSTEKTTQNRDESCGPHFPAKTADVKHLQLSAPGFSLQTWQNGKSSSHHGAWIYKQGKLSNKKINILMVSQMEPKEMPVAKSLMSNHTPRPRVKESSATGFFLRSGPHPHSIRVVLYPIVSPVNLTKLLLNFF